MFYELICPLCASRSCQFFAEDKRRSYQQCGVCALVFVTSDYLLSANSEKSEYDLHQNNPNDLRYRRFLSRLVEPLQAQLQPEDKGLDFGCGPGPTLSVVMAESGWQMDLYDPFYCNNRTVFDRQYEFITATEVIEHLYQPGTCLSEVWAMLKPGGMLALMTKLLIDKEAFMNWHYKNDPTHVCFYSQQTLMYLAKIWQANIEFVASDVIFFHKPDGNSNTII